MGIFRKLLRYKSQKQQPDIQFGRYADSEKQEANYVAWDRAAQSFENEKYLDSFRYFFDFLADPTTDNLKYELKPGRIEFMIYQGSKIISGAADQFRLKAEAKIARVEEFHLGWLRMLAEENFDLKYCRYALDSDDNIVLVFDTYVEDGSPEKLYRALKELATTADKKDDVLLNEFDRLKSINFTHTRHISQKEKEVKYQFFCDSIDSLISELESGKLNVRQIPGGMSYLLLAWIYKTDYLLKPEGVIMECVEQCHDIFFNNSTMVLDQKNDLIYRHIQEIKQIEKENFFKELYEVKSTFGIALPSGHDRLTELIDAQIQDVDWYLSNHFDAYALAICNYITGYALFAYALPAPSKDLIHLFYKITEDSFFRDLGYDQHYISHDNLHKSKILNALKQIKLKYKSEFPALELNIKTLDFTDKVRFSVSYLNMIRDIGISL
ncbi:MAG: hypothetical protein IPM42_10585 [Saprospiraceae bacterium]|nr:hypothetical protein [Saprospiraceae bacterium]